jgi:hypothetical protein
MTIQPSAVECVATQASATIASSVAVNRPDASDSGVDGTSAIAATQLALRSLQEHGCWCGKVLAARGGVALRILETVGGRC